MARRICSFGSLAAVHLTAVTAVTAVGAIAPSPAGAQETDSSFLDVSARIVQSCKIESVGVLDFGNVFVDETKNAETELTFSCTLGGEQQVTVDIDFGQYGSDQERYLSKDDVNGDIFYLVCEDSACLTPWTEPVSHTISDAGDSALPVYAQIPAIESDAGLQAGLYTDTLTVTLSY